MKSYNMQALRGHDYSDHQFKIDMMETADMNIPDHLLYTPQLNQYVMDEQHRRNCQQLQEVVNPDTQKNYTPEEARREANQLRDGARARLAAASS
jgi:hypothetical protein